MFWVFTLIVLVVCFLTYREHKNRIKQMDRIMESAERIEKLAIENEKLAKKVADKYTVK